MRHLRHNRRYRCERRRRVRSAHTKLRVNSRLLAASLITAALWPAQAHASMFKGEALDKMADVLTWVVLVVAPVVAIGVFLLIHILPEKIAERKHHPQAKAIQCLCLLSLVFGGILWPLAWLWAYTKPVLYKAAYGTDKVAPEHDHGTKAEVEPVRQNAAEAESKLSDDAIAKNKKA